MQTSYINNEKRKNIENSDVAFVGYVFFGDNVLKDKVFHVVDSSGLQVGDKVLCKIDWKRRHRFMRMHTAARGSHFGFW